MQQRRSRSRLIANGCVVANGRGCANGGWLPMGECQWTGGVPPPVTGWWTSSSTLHPPSIRHEWTTASTLLSDGRGRPSSLPTRCHRSLRAVVTGACNVRKLPPPARTCKPARRQWMGVVPPPIDVIFDSIVLFRDTFCRYHAGAFHDHPPDRYPACRSNISVPSRQSPFIRISSRTGTRTTS